VELSEINLKNIKSFFQGHARAYLDKICLLPLYTKEQVFYRIYICKDTCIPFHKCEKCTCPAIEKSYATASCNLQKFPNLMPKIEWEEYKLTNNISEEIIAKILREVGLIFNQ
jgi:hypothetical protein